MEKRVSLTIVTDRSDESLCSEECKWLLYNVGVCNLFHEPLSYNAVYFRCLSCRQHVIETPDEATALHTVVEIVVFVIVMILVVLAVTVAVLTIGE